MICSHKEFINNKETSIFSVTTKVHENEHQCISQKILVMDTLIQERRQIQVLEDKCFMLNMEYRV